MIKFTLHCAEDHRFDSWFQSSEAFDTLNAAGMVTCAVCGGTQVEKAIMAPAVRAGDSGDRPLRDGTDPAERAMAELRRKVEENSEYVGMRFAAEARDIHDGHAPERPIYGEARPDEARRLIEDGVPVAPLPFRPMKKVN